MSKLLPGENLVLRDHPHWVTLIGPGLLPIGLAVLVGIVDFTVLKSIGSSTKAVVILAGIAVALLWLIVVWIRWRAITYTLTDQRIKIESGVFGRQEKIIPIDRIQDCSTRQSLIGRMLSYGRVEIDAAGAQGAEVLDHLPKPGDFRDQVFVQSERRRGGGVPAGSQGPPVPANPGGV